jgi:hypothetical protein
MKYMLLIHQGDAPTPYDADEWTRLSEDEQKAVYAAYMAINETPGVNSGRPDGAPRDRHHGPRAGRQDADHDGPFVAVKEALGGYFFLEADDLDAAIELAARVPAARMGGSGGGAAGGGEIANPRAR